MGHEDQSQQHGMGQSGLTGNEQREGDGSPSGGMTQGTSQVGTHANEQGGMDVTGTSGADPSTAYGQEGDQAYNSQPQGAGYGQQADAGWDQQSGGGYGQDSGFAEGNVAHASGGVGQPSGGDYGVESTGGGQQGDMTTDQMVQGVDPTRSGNTGSSDRSPEEMQDGSSGSR
jgi:hypothetical protein